MYFIQNPSFVHKVPFQMPQGNFQECIPFQNPLFAHQVPFEMSQGKSKDLLASKFFICANSAFTNALGEISRIYHLQNPSFALKWLFKCLRKNFNGSLPS